MDFIQALDIANAVFAQYKADQLKWWKRMDGTPILNDVSVRMAEAFRDATKLAAAPASPSPTADSAAEVSIIDSSAVFKATTEGFNRGWSEGYRAGQQANKEGA